jgi:hypothetical protein
LSIRIHTTQPSSLAVNYIEDPSEYFEDDEMAVGPALVLDDTGNCEAFVIVGSPERIAALAERIVEVTPEVPTPLLPTDRYDTFLQGQVRFVIRRMGLTFGGEEQLDHMVEFAARQLSRALLD